MEEPREQCIVVFALVLTEPASESGCEEGVEGVDTPPPPFAGFVASYAKTTVHCSPGPSMFVSIFIGLHEAVLFGLQRTERSKYNSSTKVQHSASIPLFPPTVQFA